MIITRISDFLTGKQTAKYYSRYLKSQYFSEAEIESMKLLKLKRLIQHCYDNIPYYRKYMDQRNIRPSDINTLESVKLFPILTKEIIQEHYESFTPKNISKIKGVKTKQTGGTTGNILFNRNDSNTRSSTWATFKRFYDWMGVKERDKTLILMGGHVIGNNIKDKIKNYINDQLNNFSSFNPYDTSEENINAIIETLKKNEYVLIRSYSQFLFSIALKLKSMGIKLNVKAITTTAEPLTESHRKLFAEVFSAESFDQYGCGEIGGIAYECKEHRGLHVSEERVILEVNDKNELIITDLDNYAMPFIRYWNADEAIITDRKCTCGNNSQIIENIKGRTCDYIIGENNEFLHWAYFWHLFFDSEIAVNKNLKKFQIIQESRECIIVRLVCDDLTQDEVNMLKDNIIKRIGNLEIEFVFEKDIENSKSGKYRPVINKLL